jgi:hypothetical protein
MWYSLTAPRYKPVQHVAVLNTAHLGYVVQPTAPRYKPVQHVAVLNTAGNCNTIVKYYTYNIHNKNIL